MNLRFRIKYLVLSASVFVLAPQLVLAVDPPKEDAKGLLYRAGQRAGYEAGSPTQLSSLVGRIIYAFLGLLGVIFLVLIVYAGYLYLTAGGEEQKVEEAKKYIKNGIIGLIIVLAAFGITRFVVGSLLNATVPQP